MTDVPAPTIVEYLTDRIERERKMLAAAYQAELTAWNDMPSPPSPPSPILSDYDPPTELTLAMCERYTLARARARRAIEKTCKLAARLADLRLELSVYQAREKSKAP